MVTFWEQPTFRTGHGRLKHRESEPDVISAGRPPRCSDPVNILMLSELVVVVSARYIKCD